MHITGTMVLGVALFGCLVAHLLSVFLHAIPEKLVGDTEARPYGTTREYGFTHDNAKRSWLKRHYGVPYEKHGALYLEHSPVKQYLGLARETRPGDDSYDGTPGSMTVELFIPR